MKSWTGLAGIAAATFLASAFGAQAGVSMTPALSYCCSAGEVLGNGPFTLGWSFTVTKTITVYDLGVFDSGGEALLESHDVGLWNSSGTLLISATVDSGTTDPLIDGFRYAGITPIVLTPGTYTIGAEWDNLLDPLIFAGDPGSIGTSSAITYDQPEFVSGGALTFPTSTVPAADGYFGPDFIMNPEPMSWALMLLGIGGVGAAMRRSRRRAEQPLQSA